jgi:hypothetical protein
VIGEIGEVLRRMIKIFDLYGSRELDQETLRGLISDVVEMEFHPHSSSYVGNYYMTRGMSGEELTIKSNELEDEEGVFYQEPEFPDYKTLLVAAQNFAELPGSTPTLDGLRAKLSRLPELVFLRRSTSAQACAPYRGEPCDTG